MPCGSTTASAVAHLFLIASAAAPAAIFFAVSSATAAPQCGVIRGSAIRQAGERKRDNGREPESGN